MKRSVILVTGASAGIGEASARRLARAGHIVYAGARRMDRLKALEADGVRPVSLDVTDDASMRAVVEQIERDAGGVDVLVNNAGYGSLGALEDVSPAEARRQFDVNVFGLARLTQLVLPGMRKKQAGRIINVSSIGGRMSFPMGAWYHASKHAVEGLSDSLRMEVRDFGIFVSVIQPGGTASEWADIAVEQVVANSANGPYGELAQAMVVINKGAAGTPVPAAAIAKLIQRATEDRCPKARYVGPGPAKIGLFMRWLLSDRAYDSVMMRQIHQAGAKKGDQT